MKLINNKWLKGGVVLLLALFGMTSCSDDHFDLNTTNAEGNLWENIEATGQANDFAAILQRTIVNQKSYGVPATITYKDLLNSSRVLTVWAPKDGTYDANKWNKLLDRRDAASTDEERAKLNEEVEKQFVQNHIASFNHNGAYDATPNGRLLLMNRKYAVYDIAGNTFMGVKISDDTRYKNVASTNGTLHLLDGLAPYSPTLRELIQTNDDLTLLNNYILDKDTLVFIEGLSVAGSTVNGEIQYVDSYFVESNKILPSISMNEDSLSAAILPSNTAWTEAMEKISKHYNYKQKNSYFDSEMNRWITDTLRADSLKEIHAVNVLFNNMFYSLHEQPAFNWETATAASVAEFFNVTSDSLVSTNYYNSNYDRHQHAPDCHTLTGDNNNPLEASNGYAFVTDHFYFKANKAWQYDIKLEAENRGYVNQDRSRLLAGTSLTGVTHTVTDGTRHDSVSGVVSGYAYNEFVAQSSNSSPVVAFNLHGVLSGTYDIYVVVVPENMLDKSNNNPKINQFTADLEYDFDESGNAQTLSSEETFRSDPTKVDTILLFENFTFPYCYSGIPYSVYPVLKLNVKFTIRERATVTPNLNIDCIILKGKDE